MNILGIETSTDVCSIALQADNITFQHHEIIPQQHGRVILNWIDDLLQKANLQLSQLSFIAFSCGPGSFTGLRIGASVVQSLGYTFDLPVVPVSSLCVLAQSCYEQFNFKKVLVVQDARMDEVYYGLYELNIDNVMTSVLTDQLAHYQNVIYDKKMADCLVTGDAFEKYPKLLEQFHLDVGSLKQAKISASALIKIAQVYYNEGKYINAEATVPIYLQQNKWQKIK